MCCWCEINCNIKVFTTTKTRGPGLIKCTFMPSNSVNLTHGTTSQILKSKKCSRIRTTINISKRRKGTTEHRRNLSQAPRVEGCTRTHKSTDVDFFAMKGSLFISTLCLLLTATADGSKKTRKKVEDQNRIFHTSTRVYSVIKH